jgi:hypothetical protein
MDSPNITKMIKLRRTRYAGHITLMGKNEKFIHFDWRAEGLRLLEEEALMVG